MITCEGRSSRGGEMAEDFANLVRLVAGGENQFRFKLLEALISKDMFVPIDGEPQVQNVPDKVLATVKVLCAYDHQGYLSVGLFASEKSLLGWIPRGCRFVRASGGDICKMLVGMPVQRAYLEWDSDMAVMISREEIEILASGTLGQPSEVFGPPTIDEIKFSSPQPPLSQELKEDLRTLVNSDPRIAFAYMPQVEYLQNRGGTQSMIPQPIITVVLVPQPGLPEHDIEEAINNIGLNAQQLIPQDKPMDVITLPPNHEMLSLVMKTGSVLAINNEQYHHSILNVFSRMWEISA